jgi:type II secretory pathway pseudopilin PulG
MRRDQSGFALATVMIATMVLSMLALAAVDYAVGSQYISHHDQNWNGALAAAEAGIDDYIFRLGENGNYWQYNATNPPPDNNKAFTQYVQVSGSATNSKYRYDVDTSTIATNGIVKLTSTGRVGNAARTVRASLRRRSFLDYLYFTDFETVDPALYTGAPFTPAQAQAQCAFHYYGGVNNQRDVNGRVDFTGDSDANGSYCSDITFVGIDKLNGPMHTNDAFMVCGSPQFLGDTSTSWTGANGKLYRDNCPTSTPVFANPSGPVVAPPLTMPPTNSSIKSYTAVGTGGCLYTGPTRIKLLSDGTMTVKSPFSKNTNNAACPKNGNGARPTNGVIYVQNVPSASSDPNYTNGCPYNVNGRAHPLGMPIANDLNTYVCRNGDVFIEGTLKGQLTVAAENNVDITWHLQYNSGVNGTDLLGLIANNFVEVYHPVNCAAGVTTAACNLNASFPLETTPTRTTPFNSPIIQAANLSLSHSVRVQAWDRGAPLGTLNITGVLAQRYRGPVGTNISGVINTGFAKNYVYDQRLKYLSPPYFLDPVASQWGIVTWAENKVPAGY